MKTSIKLFLLTWCILMLGHLCYAQKIETPDTIFANDHQQVALFFPNPIRQAVTGVSNMVFTYNKERPQYFGLLQAKEGKLSNLFVVDQQGKVFSFVLKFREQLPHFYYFFSEKDAVGQETPLKENVLDVGASKETLYWKRLSDHFLRKSKGKLRYKGNDGIVLRVKNIVFHNEVFFFVMELSNNSGITYEPDRLKLFTRTKKQGKRKSMQQLPLEMLHIHSFPEKVLAENKDSFVVVVPKFTIPDNKEVLIKLFELNGARNITIKLYKRHINNSIGK